MRTIGATGVPPVPTEPALAVACGQTVWTVRSFDARWVCSGLRSIKRGGLIMKNLLALVGLALIGFAGVGWYLDWYKFKTEATVDGHRKIDVDVNTPKISQDLKKGKEKVRDIIDKEVGSNTTTPVTIF